jgi:hypothetical protein
MNNVARMGDVHMKVWQGHVKERNDIQDIGVDGGPILKWIFKKFDGSE